MKFGFFNLGPVVKPMDNDTWDEGQDRQSYKNWLDEYEQADRLGFDYLFCGEHHYQSEYTHIPAPEVFLAALSQRVKNARLGTSIAHISMYHGHPARVAERAAMLDILTDGRWEMGTAPANYNDGPGVYDAPHAVEEIQNNGSAIWEEALHEIVRMMTEEPYGGAKTEHFNISPFTLVPRPVQKPHPPLWRSGTGLGTIERCATLGVGSFNLGIAGVEKVGAAVEAYWNSYRRGVKPIGKAINPATSAFVFALCAKTDEEALKRGERGVNLFSHSIGHMRRDHTKYHHLNRSFTELMANPERPPFMFDARTEALIGSPETIAKKLREYEATNVDLTIFYQTVGDTKHEHLLESAELLATKVMPEFRERHAKHQKWREEQLRDAEFPVNATV